MLKNRLPSLASISRANTCRFFGCCFFIIKNSPFCWRRIGHHGFLNSEFRILIDFIPLIYNSILIDRLASVSSHSFWAPSAIAIGCESTKRRNEYKIYRRNICTYYIPIGRYMYDIQIYYSAHHSLLAMRENVRIPEWKEEKEERKIQIKPTKEYKMPISFGVFSFFSSSFLCRISGV